MDTPTGLVTKKVVVKKKLMPQSVIGLRHRFRLVVGKMPCRSEGGRFTCKAVIPDVMACSSLLRDKYDTLRIYGKNMKPHREAKVQWSEFIYDHYNIGGESKPVAYKIKKYEMAEDGSSMSFYYSFAQDLKG